MFRIVKLADFCAHVVSRSANWPDDTGCLQAYNILTMGAGDSCNASLVTPQLKQVGSTSGVNCGIGPYSELFLM